MYFIFSVAAKSPPSFIFFPISLRASFKLRKTNPSYSIQRCFAAYYILLPAPPLHLANSQSAQKGCSAAFCLYLPDTLSWHGLFGFSKGWQYGNAADLMDDCLKMAASVANRSRVLGSVCALSCKTLVLMFFFASIVLLYILILFCITLAQNIVKNKKLCYCE